MKRIIPLLLALALLVSCASAPKYTSYASIKGVDCPQAEFAADEIITALSNASIGISDENPQWIIRFADINPKLGEQAYHVEVLGKVIEITGGDERGLMYGGLEVAEQISLYGIENIQESQAAPYVLRRGFMYNMPLDMRAPAYNSPGTSGQDNIANMWDMDFWHDFIDEIARDRYNLILMENINPYPALVKVEGYEDVALQDVWKTNVAYDNSCKGDCTNIVDQKYYEDYDVIKTMTIEDKISFMQEVMKYAADRGIEVHLKHSNIYTFTEAGKYGITDQKDNPVTADYFYKSAKTLLETYPLLKGLYLTPGENMGWSNTAEDKADNIQWLHDVFGKAINEVLKENPEREFSLTINGDASKLYTSIFSDMERDVLYTAQYAGTHMYATSTPHTADAALSTGSADQLFWLAFRNEDSFDMRWGDPEFMKEFISGIPDQSKIFGYITGSDGYCYAREYSSTDPEFKGELYVDKHWFNFFLIGRLSFEPNLSDDRISDVFYAHYGNLPQTELLLETTAEAGKIIPQVNKIYYQTNGDYTWFVAGNWSHPSTFGYIDLKKWMKADNTYQDGTTMSVEEYALALAAGTFQDDGRQTPISVAENLRKYAEDVLANVARLKQGIGSPKTYDQKNMLKLVIDDEAMAYLGLFYSERVLGSVDIRLYNETTDEAYKASSVAHLEESAKYFDNYAEIISANYVPQQLSRVGGFNVLDIAQSVHKDVQIAETWKPRKITSSYKAPSKEEYMSSSDEQ